MSVTRIASRRVPGRPVKLPEREPDGVILFHGSPIASYWAAELPK